MAWNLRTRTRPPSNVTRLSEYQNDLPKSTSFSGRSFYKDQVIATYSSLVAHTNKTYNIQTYVTNPSPRLSLAIVLSAEPSVNAGGVINATPANAVWTINGMWKNPSNGKISFLRQCYPDLGYATLPDGYEAESAVRLYQVNITLIDAAGWTLINTGGISNFEMHLSAVWEPNVEMSDGERDYLYSLCDVSSTPSTQMGLL